MLYGNFRTTYWGVIEEDVPGKQEVGTTLPAMLLDELDYLDQEEYFRQVNALSRNEHMSLDPLSSRTKEVVKKAKKLTQKEVDSEYKGLRNVALGKWIDQMDDERQAGNIHKEFEEKLIESEKAVREEVKRVESELQGKLDPILEFMKENKNK